MVTLMLPTSSFVKLVTMFWTMPATKPSRNITSIIAMQTERAVSRVLRFERPKLRSAIVEIFMA